MIEKAYIHSHNVYFSPNRTSNVPLTASFMQNYDDVELGADVKLRNGPQHQTHAVPNPYSTSEL